MRLSTPFHIATVIGLTGMILMFSGCMTPQQKEMTCQGAETAYVAYQNIIAAGHVPSQAEIYAATIGAAFLHAYCGWTPVNANMNTGRSYVIDRNGVLVVMPPQ